VLYYPIYGGEVIVEAPHEGYWWVVIDNSRDGHPDTVSYSGWFTVYPPGWSNEISGPKD